MAVSMATVRRRSVRPRDRSSESSRLLTRHASRIAAHSVAERRAIQENRVAYSHLSRQKPSDGEAPNLSRVDLALVAGAGVVRAETRARNMTHVHTHQVSPLRRVQRYLESQHYNHQ